MTSGGAVLTVNAGSTSLKLRLVGAHDEVIRSADLGAGTDTAALEQALRGWPDAACTAHRVVHGGTRFTAAVVVDEGVERELHGLTALAPLHQPASLAAIDALRHVLPGVPAVACFDTAFHSTLPAAASTYAVPREWRENWGVRRYGFHGLSHAYCSQRAAELAGRRDDGLRVVTCHLGGGASLAAVVGGRCVDTTMGFTPLEGLVMATRSGTVDPGLVLWLQQQHDVASERVSDALEHRSGILALAGSADMRDVEARAARGDPDARLALDVYGHRLVGGIGSMAAAAGGIDVLAFTGGVGEHAVAVRGQACAALEWLGVALDPARNASADGDALVSAARARVTTVVVTAREDLQMAREARRLLAI